MPEQDSVDLQHLRRFAKARFLPRHVLGKKAYLKEIYTIPHAWESTPPLLMQQPVTSIWEYSKPIKSRTSNPSNLLHLLICPSKVVAHTDLYNLLIENTPFCSSPDSWAFPLELREITVPKLPPTSPEQAAEWSNKYWPCFYRKTNPFGAHPGAIAKAEDKLHYPDQGFVGVEEAMQLARRAAKECDDAGYGLGPGCAVIERSDTGTEIIAVAGDARKMPTLAKGLVDDQGTGCKGNPMGHAVMRAVGMVGRKRLRVASQPIRAGAEKAERGFELAGLDHDESARDAFFQDLPLTPLEEEHYRTDNLKPDGYLCLRLEIFLTHEPCIMCSMALVHSRVGRVIFEERMPQTGGLTAELVSNSTGTPGLGYGLAWRKELNWQFMCWEYTAAQKSKPGNVGGGSGGGKAKSASGNVEAPSSPIYSVSSSRYGALADLEDDDSADETEAMSMSDSHKANMDSFASTHV